MAGKFGQKAAATTAAPAQTQAPAASTGGTKQYKNVQLFDLREQEIKDRETGNPVKKLKIQFQKGTQILVNGREVDLGEYNNLFVKDAEEIERDLNFKEEKGWITAEQKAEKIAFYEEKNVVFVADAKFKD